MESVVHEGDQVTKPTPPTRTDRYGGAEVCRVGGEQEGRTQTDMLTGAVQDTESEEAVKLVGDRMGLTMEAEVGRLIKIGLIKGMKINKYL